MSDDLMRYSRPGGMSSHERAKTLARLGGGKTPNASGATQEAPPILAGSTPSAPLKPPLLTPEEIEAAAAHNRLNRAQAALSDAEADEMEKAALALQNQGAPPLSTDETPPATDALLE